MATEQREPGYRLGPVGGVHQPHLDVEVGGVAQGPVGKPTYVPCPPSGDT
jgi:hypothetical protein